MMKTSSAPPHSGSSRTATVPADRSYDPAPGERVPHLWGYSDTRFEFCDDRSVRVTGTRYPLAGPPLPRFLPFVEEILGVRLGPEQLQQTAPPPVLSPPVRHEGFLDGLNQLLGKDQISDTEEDRLIHSHGQLSVDEIYRILQGEAPPRTVDLVAYPKDEDEVVALVKLANRCKVVIIPYGGGTNVSGALLCPEEERRMIVSVDLCHLNRILAVDRANNWAVVQAGITGKELESRLEEAGLTCGHIPDSIELSTLGGWIATNASGMKKSRYGNIEDIVLEATLVTPRGELSSRPLNPRSSPGIHPRHWLFGSEGCLGIITRAVLQVRPVPEQRRFASFVFRDFDTGVQFLKAVQFSGARPASLRLANNSEFRLGQALSPSHGGWKGFIAGLKKRYLLDWKRFDPQQMVACTAVMEGNATEVGQQARTLHRLTPRFGGLSGGAEGGKRGYRVTFAIAYIRDFLNRMGILGETFETSAPWDRVSAITDAVEQELRQLCVHYEVPGRPYLSWRVSQTYPTGVCIYFTMGFSGRGLPDAVQRYQKIEYRLREVILENGGSISHHHGVGKVRRDFVAQVYSDAAISALHALKQSLDPDDVFAARNNVFGVADPTCASRAPADAQPAESEPDPP